MYNSESELVKAFNQSFRGFLSEIGINDYETSYLVNEYDSIHNGIADIVIGLLNNSTFSQFRSPIEPNIVSFLDNLPLDKSFNIEKLIESSCNSKRYINNSLRLLSDIGFIRKLGNGRYIKIKDYSFPNKYIISIEAKLKNWKKALHQAYRYKQFSDFTYVLLDEKFSTPAIKSIQDFKKYNIGLVTLDSEQSLSVKYTPYQYNNTNSIYYYRANEYLYNSMYSCSKDLITACSI